MIVALLLLLAQAPADSQPGRVLPPEANADRQSLEAKCLEVVDAARTPGIDPDTAAALADEARALVKRIAWLPRMVCCCGWTYVGSAAGGIVTGCLGVLLWPPIPNPHFAMGPNYSLGSVLALAAGAVGGAGIAAAIYSHHSKCAHQECREDVSRLVERLNRALAEAQIPPSPSGDN